MDASDRKQVEDDDRVINLVAEATRDVTCACFEVIFNDKSDATSALATHVWQLSLRMPNPFKDSMLHLASLFADCWTVPQLIDW